MFHSNIFEGKLAEKGWRIYIMYHNRDILLVKSQTMRITDEHIKYFNIINTYTDLKHKYGILVVIVKINLFA